MRRDYGVVIAGPTTMQAILSAFRMGFQTLTIQKKSNEVWKLLSSIRGEFSKFGVLLEKTQEKLEDAGKVLADATARTKIIEGKLNKVEALPHDETVAMLSGTESES